MPLGVSHRAPTPKPPISKLPCELVTIPHRHAQFPQIAQSQSTRPRGDTSGHQQASTTSLSPSPTNISCTYVRGRWRFCRLGTLVPGPEGLRRPWDTGAAGSGAPELIGDPGNNEGWKAGGLIGPGSGLAFCLRQGPTTGRAVPGAELRLAAGTQRSASRATLGGDVHGGRRGKEGTTLLAAPGARGLSTPWSITPLHRRREENAAATTSPCPAFAATLLGVSPYAWGPSRRSRSVLPPGVSSPLRRLL